MSWALIFGAAGLFAGIVQFVVLSRLAPQMKQKEATAKTGRLLQAIAWVDLVVLPTVAYYAGSLADMP